MSALSALVLAGARGVATLQLISIDSCVDVDAEEVRRLADIELKASLEASSRLFDVAVSCTDGAQELRLTDRASRHAAVRGIDLSASGARDRAARARELALAIAELIRRTNQDVPAEPPAQKAAVAPARPPLPARPRSDGGPPWRSQLGVSAVVDGWTGGEALVGAELSGRVHLGRWLIGELRLGARKTRPIDFENGTMDAEGVAASAGLSLDATPYARRAGVAFGARLGVARLRYSAVSDDSVRLGTASVSAVSANATVSGFFAIWGPIGLLVDASIGGALHTVAIREKERSLSAMSGLLLSSALGLTAQF